jgi:hypothetical protein
MKVIEMFVPQSLFHKNEKAAKEVNMQQKVKKGDFLRH